MARDITFKNKADIKSKQAVVFKSDSDESFLDTCEFIGHRGALHSVAGRQLYQSCRIKGNDDVIFGNGAAIFKNCEIFVNSRPETPEKGEENVIAAQGRTDPTQETGFIFNNCTVTGTSEYMKLFESDRAHHKNFLGRPLGEFARIVFINSSLDSIIEPAGWTEREGDKSSGTLYFGEFKNKGGGSDLKGRVAWSSQIPAENVVKYSFPNFFGASTTWLPYDPSLYW
ncbi:Plant invertase/pectin methylesterase inhibitor superfamily [Euphorbia peplus]|nr:Plant invertase/pectin methylesterase inhibitor superfamily [Euphorbia peplus]